MEISVYTDEELLSQYTEGEDAAFVELVNRYLKPIYNFTYRICRDKKDAEEITQESFVKIWKHIEKFRQGEKFKTWAYTIAHHTAIDWMRKKKSIAFSEFDSEDGSNFLEDTLTDTEKLADEIFEISEHKKIVGDALETLTGTYKEVLLLRYHEDLAFEEIAKILKKPINTVKSQHRRALLILRKNLSNAPKQPL